jgi:serine/threonine-protein kinase
VFAVDDSLGVPAIAMEFVPGLPLSRLIAEGPLDPARAARIGRQVAEGVAAAHGHGFVHGDLKPENVLLADGDAVKIVDFGLSRREHPPRSSDATWDAGSDFAGISGTPSYLAPERTWGEPATAAGDVFSLGLVLHEMLTGHKAFATSDLLELLWQIRRIDPTAIAAQVPAPFAPVLRRALEPDPKNRDADMHSIAAALDASLSLLETV